MEGRRKSTWKSSDTEGDIPVPPPHLSCSSCPSGTEIKESGCLKVQPQYGWYTPPKAKHDCGRPIAHKYRKVKMQRTLKREFEELEIVESEAIEATAMMQPPGIWAPARHAERIGAAVSSGTGRTTDVRLDRWSSPYPGCRCGWHQLRRV